MRGPYLRAALFCKSVDYDVDGAMTITGIYDRITLSPVRTFPTQIEVKLVVSVIRGDAQVGPTLLVIRLIAPDNSEASFSFPFQLPESVPFTYTPTVTFKVHDAGLYWIDLSVLDVSLTRIPLPIVQGTHVVVPQSGSVQ
jgi:hypothetical protein